MLSRLSKRLGVGGVALKWFESYLKGRKQSVVFNETLSSPVDVLYGVPQGSVLGPKLFTIYTLPIADIARKYNLELHLYADDTQIYINFRTSDNISKEIAIKLVQSCIAEIKIWMLVNKLQLSDGKTEFLLIDSLYFRKTITTTHINFGNDNVPLSTSARNLGIVFDQHMNFEEHINNIRRSCFQHLKRISDIRKYITEDITKQLVHAFITLRLDNVNYLLLYGLPTSTISNLQKIQSSAARLITHTRKFDSITPVLQNRHWLPIEKRIIFKINVLTFRAMHGTAPQYLADLLHIHTPSRKLRSSSKALLSVVRPRLDVPRTDLGSLKVFYYYYYYMSYQFELADSVLWSQTAGSA